MERLFESFVLGFIFIVVIAAIVMSIIFLPAWLTIAIMLIGLCAALGEGLF